MKTSDGTMVKDTNETEVQEFLDNLNLGTVLAKEEQSPEETEDVQSDDGEDEEAQAADNDSTDEGHGAEESEEEETEGEEEVEEEAGEGEEEAEEAVSIDDQLAAALSLVNTLSKTENLNPLDLPGEEAAPAAAPQVLGLVELTEEELEEVTRDPKVFNEYIQSVLQVATQNAVLQTTAQSKVQSSEDRLFEKFFTTNEDLAPVAEFLKSTFRLAKAKSPTATPTIALEAAAKAVRANLKLSASIQEAGSSKNIKRKKTKGPSKGRHAQRGGNSKSVKAVKSAEEVVKTKVDLLQDDLFRLKKAGRS